MRLVLTVNKQALRIC